MFQNSYLTRRENIKCGTTDSIQEYIPVAAHYRTWGLPNRDPFWTETPRTDTPLDRDPPRQTPPQVT